MGGAVFVVPRYQWFNNGVVAAGGSMYVYNTNTTTLANIYTNASLATPAANPITLDSNGEGGFYTDGTMKLRLDGYTQSGTLIRSIDPVYVLPDLSAFTGTGADLNVLAGVVAGVASANKAIVLDANLGVSGLQTNLYGRYSDSIANMNAVNGSMTGGGVNKFRNGEMTIAQRGASGTITAGANAYSLDGWIVGAAGANLPWAWANATLSGLLGENISALQLNTAVGVTDAFVRQRIESKIAAELAGHDVTVQFLLYHNIGSSITPTITIKHATAADNWGATVTDINSQNLQVCTTATLTTVAYTFTAHVNSSNGLEATIDFGTSANIAGKNIYLTLADIRATDGATTGKNSFPPIPERRPIGEELLLCQRYFEKSFSQGTTPAQNVGANSGELNFIAGRAGALVEMGFASYKATKRATPTVTFYNPAAANAQVRDESSAVDCSATALSSSNDNGFTLTATGNGATAVGAILGVHWSSSAEL